MTKKMKQYPNPRFSSLEEEDEYWKTHSPLDEGYEGEVQKSKQQRSSFLSIRLTGDELTQLRDMAAKVGVGPSTYVRHVLNFVIQQENLGTPYPFYPMPYPSYLSSPLYSSTDEVDSAKPKLGDEKAGKRICVFNLDELEVNPAFMPAMFDAMFKACGAKMVTPEDDGYDQVQRIMEARR